MDFSLLAGLGDRQKGIEEELEKLNVFKDELIKSRDENQNLRTLNRLLQNKADREENFADKADIYMILHRWANEVEVDETTEILLSRLNECLMRVRSRIPQEAEGPQEVQGVEVPQQEDYKGLGQTRK